MELPRKFPFDVRITYHGKEITPISDEAHQKIIKALDPYCEERRECRVKILEGLLNPFSLFLHKYPIIKRIFHEKSLPKNVTLLSILEDALKQNITDLSNIITSFIKFIDECKGKYQILFKRKAQHKFFKALINGNTPDNQELLRKRIEEIDLKRNGLFIKFNSKGTPSSESFDCLKGRAEDLRKEIRAYRDKVAAHNDVIQPSITWEVLDANIENFKNLISDFYSVLSFERAFGEAQGPGLLDSETTKMLIEEIYSERRN